MNAYMEGTRDYGRAAWKQEQETKAYRDVMAKALIAARHFDGSEEEYGKLMETLVELEKRSSDAPSLQHLEKADRETAAVLQFSPDHPRDIQELLDVAIQSRNNFLHKSLTEERSEMKDHKEKGDRRPLFVVRVDGIFLPPKVKQIQAGDGAGEFQVGRLEGRLADVMDVLSSLDVYTDDIIVMMGKTDPAMMRQVSYAAVRIPRIHRSLLVCDQVGEATFVLKGDISADTLFSVTKEQLQLDWGNQVQKVIRHDVQAWKTELLRLLQSDAAFGEEREEKGESNKVNVREYYRQTLGADIRRKFTSEQWVALSSKERLRIKIGGRGLVVIASMFGIGNPIAHRVNHLLFGMQVYGSEAGAIQQALALEQRSPEAWAERIKGEVSVERWVALKAEERQALKIDEYGIGAIGGIFGVKDPGNKTLDHLLLGTKIFGENHPVIQPLLSAEQARVEKNRKTPEVIKRTAAEWVSRIRQLYTAEQFLQLNQESRKTLHIDGMGIAGIASRFGTGNPLVGANHLALCAKIFEEGQPAVRLALETSRRTPEQWIERAAKEWTAEAWTQKTAGERDAMTVDGISIVALASLLGVENPQINFLNYYALGAKIYGADNPFIKEALTLEQRTPAQWRERIKGVITAERWVALSQKERRALKIDGRGIAAIATVFGAGDPLVSRNHILLGIKIYGEDDPAIKPLKTVLEQKEHKRLSLPDISTRTAAEWSEHIRKLFTAEQWIGISTKSRNALKIDGKGIAFIASMFGVKDETYLEHLLLGAVIYGEDEGVIKAEVAIERRTSEEWAKRIRELFTAEQWVQLTGKQLREVHIDGRGISHISNVFGLGNPLSSRPNHFMISAKIFGESNPAISRALEKIKE